MGGVSGFTLHYPQLGAQDLPQAYLGPWIQAQPHTERAVDALDYADGSARLSEA